MPPELRKRKAPAAEPSAVPPAKKKGPIAKAVAKVKEVVSPKAKAKAEPKKNGALKAKASASTGKIAVGETITLEGFGGEIETNDGTKTTLKALVDESKSGVVLFTYPKASTPGCKYSSNHPLRLELQTLIDLSGTTQVCLFRDSYTPLTSTGFAIYGLSKDSPKANTTFKEKQKLPYPLLCDQSASLISAIGLKKAPAGTTRGVFVVDKSGKILAAEAGGPAATVEVVKKLIGSGDVPTKEKVEAEAPVTNGTNGATKEDVAKADVAGEVADTAEKLDSEEAKVATA